MIQFIIQNPVIFLGGLGAILVAIAGLLHMIPGEQPGETLLQNVGSFLMNLGKKP